MLSITVYQYFIVIKINFNNSFLKFFKKVLSIFYLNNNLKNDINKNKNEIYIYF